MLKRAHKAEIKTYNGKIYPIEFIVAENESADLIKVLVEISGESVSWLKVIEGIPDVAERILVVGSPMGLEQTVSEGIISAMREVPKVGKLFQISAPISPGSSGSPVVNMKGEVIGVATFQFIEGQNLNFAIPGKYILNLKNLPKRETMGARYAQDMAPFLKMIMKGLEYKMQQDYTAAREVFEQAVQMKPDSVRARSYLADCYLSLELYKEAVETVKQSLPLHANKDYLQYAELYHILGQSYSALGHNVEAIEAYREAYRSYMELDSDPTSVIYIVAPLLRLGTLYSKLARHEEAIEVYKRLISLRPDNGLYRSNLGGSYFELGRYELGIDALRQAIQRGYENDEIYYNLGLSYSRLHRYSEAIEAFRQAIRINPDCASAHYGLGLAYLISANKRDALVEYKILQGLDNALANKLFSSIYR